MDTINETQNESDSKVATPSPVKLQLQFGDIIEISAPLNDELDNKIFLIDYLDITENKQMRIIDTDTLNQTILRFDDNAEFTEKSIQSIAILNRPEEKGYARQYGLLPNTWIEMKIGGDIPTILVGQITDLEEDQIEIKLYPSNDTIYIDFAYKGIPLDIPIEYIHIRDEPMEVSVSKTMEEGEEERKDEEEEGEVLEEGEDEDETKKPTLYDAVVPVTRIQQQVEEMFIDLDDFTIGDEVFTMNIEVQVPESQKRYSIEAQTKDFMDDLLSNIPNIQRTEKVLNSLHTIITRFKQLRDQFSIKDENDVIVSPLKRGENYKPLINHLYTLNKKLHWLLPVVKQTKIIYTDGSVQQDEDDEFKIDDVVQVNFAENLQQMKSIYEEFKTNTTNTDNKYDYLIEKLYSLNQPFQPPRENLDCMDEIFVKDNINVIISNFENLYSSVVEGQHIKERRFVINQYNLGYKRMVMPDTIDKYSLAQQYSSKELFPNDNACVQSMITLPEPYLHYSHINLPSTSIYMKTNLNHTPIAYWKFLRENTGIVKHTITSLDTSKEMNYDMDGNSAEDGNGFLDVVRHIMLDDSLTHEDKYKRFLEIAIPKTKTLFKLVRKYMKDQSTYVKIVDFLEPFMIYKDDISYKQYQEIVEFIIENLTEIRRRSYSNSRHTQALRSLKTKVQFSSSILINILSKFMDLCKESYGLVLENQDIKLFTSEILVRTLTQDYGKYYHICLSLLDDSLYSTLNIQDVLQEKIEELQEQGNDARAEDNQCMNYVLTKEYTTSDELQADNGRIDVFYDKKFDTTPYAMLDDYATEQQSMTEEEFTEFMTKTLMENIGLKEVDARRDVDAMLLGKRRVEEGNYAVFIDIENPLQDKMYFRRENNEWVVDTSVTKQATDNLNRVFCNVSENCIQMKDDIELQQCKDTETAKLDIMKQSVEKISKDIMSSYNEDYELKKTELALLFEEYKENLQRIREYREKQHTKNNDLMYQLGLTMDDVDIVVSPYAKLRDLILAEQDIFKKMNLLSRFIREYTRTNQPDSDESPYWYYCIETNIKLLPTFFMRLAQAVLSGENYEQTLQSISSERGVLSDDGDKIVDKHSGYTIRMIDTVNDEGFDEAGFRIVSNDILIQEQGGDVVVQEKDKDDKKELLKSLSKEGMKIMKIVNTFMVQMGIKLGEDVLFIVKQTTDMLMKLPIKNSEAFNKFKSNEKYEKMFRIYPDYNAYYNYNMIVFTTIFFLVTAQTMIPKLRITKSFPGCKPSLSGFPIENNTDFSTLQYIVCIMKTIAKSSKSIEPWNSIHKLTTKSLENDIQQKYEKYIQKNSDVKNRIELRTSYEINKQTQPTVPNELDISRWQTFLPPLRDIDMKEPAQITDDFRNSLQSNLKNGRDEQLEQLLVIQTKIIYYTLAIQREIQKVVNNENPLLETANGVAYLENFCCNDDDTNAINTYQYFNTKTSKQLEKWNTIIRNLTRVYKETIQLAKPSVLFSDEDTKLKYPPVRKDYSEETIYRAFISHCKFNKDVPILDEVRLLCIDTESEFSYTDSIQDIIRILKSEGKVFTKETLQRLMYIVNRENIIHLQLETSFISLKHGLENVLQYLDDKNSKVDTKIRETMADVLDSFETLYDEEIEEVRELRNYLITKNNQTKQSIRDFINSNAQNNKSKKTALKFLETIEQFNTIETSNLLSDKEQTTVNTMSYIKNCIYLLVNVFPNVILNDLNKNEISIPKHWKLAKSHENDLIERMRNAYKLHSFGSMSIIAPILKSIQSQTKDLMLLIQHTPFMTNVNNKVSIFNADLMNDLYMYYLLSIFETHIRLLDMPLVDVLETEEQQRIDGLRGGDGSSAGVMESKDFDETMLEGMDIQDDTINSQLQGYDKIRDTGINKEEQLATLLCEYCGMLNTYKSNINMNKQQIYDIVHRIKNKEKDTMTSRLDAMEREQLDTDNELRKLGLGDIWGIALQEGVRNYDPDFYEREREMGALSNYEKEAYNLHGLPDDDDYGDRDGDDEGEFKFKYDYVNQE